MGCVELYRKLVNENAKNPVMCWCFPVGVARAARFRQQKMGDWWCGLRFESWQYYFLCHAYWSIAEVHWNYRQKDI